MYMQAKRITDNPLCEKAFRALTGTNNDLFEKIEKECDSKQKEAEDLA
jgi:hypothetical protein